MTSTLEHEIARTPGGSRLIPYAPVPCATPPPAAEPIAIEDSATIEIGGSLPRNARVTIDRRRVGRGSHRVPVGLHHLRAEATGYTSVSDSIEVDAILEWYDFDEGDSDTSLDLRGRYYFSDSFSVQAKMNLGADFETIAIGVRTEFGGSGTVAE